MMKWTAFVREVKKGKSWVAAGVSIEDQGTFSDLVSLLVTVS